jgi:hypothetical protein
MTWLTLALLGGFEFRTDLGRPLPVSPRKARALLAYPAPTPRQAHPRDKPAALLWGELSPGMARKVGQAHSLLRDRERARQAARMARELLS